MDDADASPRTAATVPNSSPSPPANGDPGPAIVGTFDLGAADEASGLALSVRNAGALYVVDDGPGTTGVLAVDITDGGITPVTVEGLRGRDTEGLAVGACADGTQRSCLFIGDIGNNLARPQRVRVWRVPEPPLDGTGEPITVDGDAATLRYPDGPVDAEALLVDDGRPLLVTKPRPDPTTGVAPPPRLLGADAFADGVLRDLGAIDLPDPPLGLASAVVGNVVTGGDADGDRVVLRTYDHVVVYAPPEPGAPVTTLPTWTPTVVDTPRLPQPEAVALDHCGLWLISEGVESIWLVPGVAGSDDHDVREQACPTGTARS